MKFRWMHRWSDVILFSGMLGAISPCADAQTANFPHLEGEALSGRKIMLPDDARGKIALVAIGFSKKSGDVTHAWGKRFRKDFGADPKYTVYPLAELEGAPHFVRGMILGSRRRGTPAAEQDHFITLFQGEADLKQFVGFSGTDDAYLFLLDAQGKVQWHGHGVFREEDYGPLRDAAKKLGAP